MSDIKLKNIEAAEMSSASLRSGWINIYRNPPGSNTTPCSCIWPTKAIAGTRKIKDHFVTCIEIQWEDPLPEPPEWSETPPAFSSEELQEAEKALARLDNLPKEDIKTWAKILASDLSKFED